MVDNDGSKQTLDVALKTQTDPYIVKGNNTTQYPYLDETDSGKYLKCTGYYVPTTDIAILITEKMDSKITQLLDALETAFS